MNQEPSTDVLERIARLEETVERLEETLSLSCASIQRKVQRLSRRLPTPKGEPKEPYLPYLIDLAGLSPASTVLDVGCGAGKIANELAPYLGTKGTYHGIEIQRHLIDRLKERYEKIPNFHFHLADVANSAYNPDGSIPAETYQFPVPEGSVDVVVLRSVFTHMLPDEIERYVAEIARVLRDGGRCLSTFFLANDQTEPFIADSFPYDYGIYRLRIEHEPARAVAVAEKFVRGTYSRHGLRIVEPIRYGSWGGRPRTAARQDVVVAERR
jgi:SAM-dependent methyltransferase